MVGIISKWQIIELFDTPYDRFSRHWFTKDVVKYFCQMKCSFISRECNNGCASIDVIGRFDHSR